VKKSDDYDLRAVLVTALLDFGIERNSIRHEITLDTSSSGGRADLVLLQDHRITGYEVKSGKDNFDRCDEQRRAYAKCFDRSVLLADRKFAPISETVWPDASHKALWLNTLCYDDGKITDRYSSVPCVIFPLFFHDSVELSAHRMLSLLWAQEISVVAKSSVRHKGIKSAAETMCIKDIRRGVVEQLRMRRLNKWEEAFWKKFDVPPTEEIAGVVSDVVQK
jgi:hypothetical protein